MKTAIAIIVAVLFLGACSTGQDCPDTDIKISEPQNVEAAEECFDAMVAEKEAAGLSNWSIFDEMRAQTECGIGIDERINKIVEDVIGRGNQSVQNIADTVDQTVNNITGDSLSTTTTIG